MSGFDLTGFVAGRAPRAAGFIVTLYGDVVVPRGGELGMAAIIEACALVGISETLVRTAVSRLVAAGQLQGDRQGRRSFYRLTPSAEAEFAAAARVIYGPPGVCGWRLVIGPDAALEGAGLVRLRPGVALGPARGPVPPGAAVLEGATRGEGAAVAALAAQLWDLGAVAAAFRAVQARFAPLLGLAAGLPGDQALALRLLLVHDWRLAVLSDPALPPQALPPDWPGTTSRAVFSTLYDRLSSAAERHVAARLDASAGPLAATTAVSRARLKMSRESMNPELICDVSEGIS